MEKERDELKNASPENVAYIINWIKKKVNLVNPSLISPEHIDLEQYDHLLDLYEMMRKKERFTMGELDALVGELGQMRKR